MRRLDVDRMRSEMTSSEFAEWEAAIYLGAFDTPAWADRRAGVIASTVANMAGMKLTGEQTKPEDFFPDRTRLDSDEPDPQKIGEQLLAIFAPMTGASRGSN